MSDHQNLGIGQIITDPDLKKDAIHVAIAPCIAGEKLQPGDHVGWLDNGLIGETNKPFGIVDPYLRGPAKYGERVWVFLYPKTITNLRHDWDHPAFKPEAIKEIKEAPKLSASQQWMMRYAENELEITYQDLMGATFDYLTTGEYLYDGPRFEGYELPDGFWDHYEKITGTKVPKDKRYSFFACSC